MVIDAERLALLQSQGWEFKLKAPVQTGVREHGVVEIMANGIKFLATPPKKPEIIYGEWHPTCYLHARRSYLRQQWERFPINGGIRQTEWRSIPRVEKD